MPGHDNNIYFQLALIFPECRSGETVANLRYRIRDERRLCALDRSLKGKSIDRSGESVRLSRVKKKNKNKNSRAIGNGLEGEGRRKEKEEGGRKKTTEGTARIPYKPYMLSWVSTSEEYDGGDVSLNI